MKQILCVFIFGFNIYLSLLLQAQNLTYKSLPKNLTVTLNYWQQVNGFFAYNEKLPDDCKIKKTINKRIIICSAWVKIIINKNQLLSWQHEQNKNGFINLYLPKIGIRHEKVKITKIKKTIQQATVNKNQHLVIAVYMRYAHVLKYKIKDTNTGKISVITATPEHKFYETTYKKFISISELRPDNTITNASNHHLKIICTSNKNHNCGTPPLISLQKVYNMEVEKAQNYFAGTMKVLVHNGCYDEYFKCNACKEFHAIKSNFSDECSITVSKIHDFKKIYQCETCGLSSSRKKSIDDHQIIHKKIPGAKYICSACDGNLDKATSLGLHWAMHKRNNFEIFCGLCDKRISLTDKLSGEHSHELYSQPGNITKSLFRERSKSPIRYFLPNAHTLESPSFENLDFLDLRSYIN